MYHRVAVPEADIWDIAVSPANFEQQLQVLQQSGHVIPLEDLAKGVKNNSLKRNSISITFDDGYIDNYQVAKPLLEKYGLPATFFITSGNVGQAKEFWWDELEHLILFTEDLPAAISVEIAGTYIEYDLSEEAHLNKELREKHVYWKACEDAPPTLRGEIFYKLWELIKPLTPAAQQEQLVKLRTWAKATGAARQDYISVSEDQLLELSQQQLFTVGAHTKSHVALAFHPEQTQEQELLENRKFLAEVIGQEVSLLAYPYGNYNEDTVAIADMVNFAAAFTTEEKPVTKRSHLHRLGRFQVKNLSGKEFRQQLQAWKNSL
jgi:peptidoglycan/xylan/chitin deacetylase (PgdA/CDA1 family)